jgi:hypothetical protein
MATIVKGDGGSKVSITVTDAETDAPIDLTGKAVKLRFNIAGGVLKERDMTVLNQTTNVGQVEYQFLTTDLDASGELEAEYRIGQGQSDQLTSASKLRITVRDPKA